MYSNLFVSLTAACSNALPANTNEQSKVQQHGGSNSNAQQGIQQLSKSSAQNDVRKAQNDERKMQNDERKSQNDERKTQNDSKL